MSCRLYTIAVVSGLNISFMIYSASCCSNDNTDEMKDKEVFQKLLTKYSSGVCTEDEVREMIRLLEKDPELYELLDTQVNHDWWIQSLTQDPPVEDPNAEPNSGKRFPPLGRWSIAAGILMLIATGLYWWNLTSAEVIEYTTGYGERQKIELPDGSQVEMNANSRLVWDANWERTGVRSVTLDGEAYFDVVKNEARKFQVSTGELQVHVLGTSFNVFSRRGATEVYLLEGKVELQMEQSAEQLTMAPGDKIEYNKTEHKLKRSEKQTLYSAAAWKTGVISYQKVTLQEIIPELGDIYGIQLVCDDPGLNEKIMDVGVPYMDWNATKESLELAMKVVIEQEGEFFRIKNNE